MHKEDLIAGRFRLEAEVGTGGMGTVYRGRDLHADVPVAVKVLHLKEVDAVERFQREATLLSRVSHPGIVKYFDHGTTRHADHYLVMEWINGETLHRRLERKGLTVRESVDLLGQVARALHEVHRLGIVHRDITPRNLMFHVTGETEQIKIVDFGIARQQKLGGLTHTGLAVGSPGYMAPEQVRGEKMLDGRADIFAIGCILYQCLAGRAPFVGDPFALAMKVLMSDPLAVGEINVEVSPELSALVSQMLAKNSADRPKDAAEVAAALSALREKQSMQRRRSSVLKTDPTTLIAPNQKTPEVKGSNAQQLNFLILVGATEPSDAPAPDPLATAASPDGAVAAAVALQQGFWERLEDGSIVVRLAIEGEPLEAAERALSCALSIRAAIRDAPMALVGDGAGSSDVERLIERGSTILGCEAMDFIFGNTPEGLPVGEVIRLDEATQKLVPSRHSVVRTGNGIYLKC